MAEQYRILRANGELNLELRGTQKSQFWKDLYHFLLTLSWPRFMALVLISYVLINVFFAALYYLLQHSVSEQSFETPLGVLDSFFFSVQTFATIGYGRIAPIGVWANLIVCAEALVGMTGMPLVTGMVFSRFARPTAQVVYSKKALLTLHDGMPSLMIRVANARINEVSEARARAMLLLFETSAEGKSYRVPYELKLDGNNTPVFALSWTLVHTVDSTSPLYGKTVEELAKGGAEIFVMITGTDQTLALPIYSRHSYVAEDLVQDKQFADVLSHNPQSGRMTLNLSLMHDLTD